MDQQGSPWFQFFSLLQDLEETSFRTVRGVTPPLERILELPKSGPVIGYTLAAIHLFCSVPTVSSDNILERLVYSGLWAEAEQHRIRGR